MTLERTRSSSIERTLRRRRFSAAPHGVGWDRFSDRLEATSTSV